jgi:hypothetical protein
MPKAAREHERLLWEHPQFGYRAVPVACEGPKFRVQKTICRALKASDRHPLFYKERELCAFIVSKNATWDSDRTTATTPDLLRGSVEFVTAQNTMATTIYLGHGSAPPVQR